MPPTDTPLNTAHQHAASADDYLAKGLLIPASEEHYKAAEAYSAALERATEESTKRTLRMLYNDHCKAGKELQRKIMKLREENKDPSLPQKPEPPIVSSKPTNYNLKAPSSPQTSSHSLSESQNKPGVDESFMLLGGQRSDPGDAFNQFWKIMEGMMDKLSQPVAFATAPLTAGDARHDGSVSSDTDIEDPLASRVARRIGLGKKATGSKLGSLAKSRPTPGDDFTDDFSEDGFDDDGLSESFCLVPSGAEPSPAVLKRENLALKLEVETLTKRLAAAERVLQLRKEQDQQLKDSIIMARREAHRAMGASALIQRPAAPGAPKPPIDLNNLPPVPVPATMAGGITPAGRDREQQHLRRIRELEEELRTVKADNEKQKAMIVKFRERWEKLKESAKRKKDAKAAANAANAPVRERIDEDPEGEIEGESKELSNAGSEQ